MQDKKFWDDVYRKGFTPWIDKGKDSAFAEKIVNDTKLDQSTKVLDYGCGEGKIGEYFLEHGLHVDFAEISSIQVDFLRKKFGGKSNIFEVTEPKDISIDEKYDVIICSTVLHRIEPEKWSDFLQQFNVLLEEGGQLWISGFDRSDQILQDEAGKFRATDGNCYFIADILDDAQKSGFEILNNDFKEVNHNNFEKPRTYRFICLRTKKQNSRIRENVPDLKFNISNDRVEYINHKMQKLRDKRNSDASENIDQLFDKQQKMKKALSDNDIEPEEMGKTGKNWPTTDKDQQIAAIQHTVYKKLKGIKNEK
ncbi:MAG: class I SAM-dependent methyltransferase [Alphaproteobacteria bacterium]|nr:class I SAM-dependent methyltransferase [Alphaproteobacteria bacterium]